MVSSELQWLYITALEGVFYKQWRQKQSGTDRREAPVTQTWFSRCTSQTWRELWYVSSAKGTRPYKLSVYVGAWRSGPDGEGCDPHWARLSDPLSLTASACVR
ncbi:hypothetical protein MHYP_G00040570 [Metynnis hypsauchen]